MRKQLFAVVWLAVTFGLTMNLAGHQGSPGRESRSEDVHLVLSDGSVIPVGPNRSPRDVHVEQEPPSSAGTAGLTWNFQYRDVVERTGFGFDDPSLGAARRKALEDTFAYITLLLRSTRNATLSVVVQRSISDTSGRLATGGTFWPGGANGFHRGYAATHIQTGRDPDASKPDVSLTFNFYRKWHLGAGSPPSDAWDFRSVALHEILHALGFTSHISSNGRSTITNSNPGRFSTYDQLIGRASDGRRLVDNSGRFVGTVADLNGSQGERLRWFGTQGVAAAGGRAPVLFTPNPWLASSSISHLSPSEGRLLMSPGINQGERIRAPSKIEEGMLRDLGYPNARIPGTGLYEFAGAEFYAAAGQVVAAVVQELDDKAGPDLVLLEQPASGPATLRVFSGYDRTRSYALQLPGDFFAGMAPAVVGPMRANGLVLATLSQETLLSLGGLRLPAARTVLSTSDFAHVHRAMAPQSGTSPSALLHGMVAGGDLDQNGWTDFLTVSARNGLVRFLDDATGYYDLLGDPRTIAALPSTVNPALSLALYETGGPNLGFEVPFGLWVGSRDVATVSEAGGSVGYLSRQGSYEAYRLNPLARYGVVGVAALQPSNLGTPDLARIRVEGDRYSITERWQGFGEVTDIRFAPDSGLVLLSSSTRHVIYQMGLSSGAPQLLAGSSAGHVDGPVASARFNRPSGMCVQGRNVYVVDSANFLIRRIDLQARTVSTVAGRSGVSATTDGPAGTASFSFRWGATCAVIGDSLYVIDGASGSGPWSLRKVNINNGYVTTVPSWLSGPYQYPRYLTAHQNKLFFLQGPVQAATLQTARTFAPATVSGSGGLVRIGDVTRDGRPDAAVLLPVGFRTLNLYPNLGGGRFGSPVQLVFAADPINIELADVNGDGRTDVIATFARSVGTYLGNGTGVFVEDPQQAVQVASSIAWSEFRDLNRDGRLDAVLLTQQGRLLIMHGNAQRRWGTGAGENGEDNLSILDVGANPVWFGFVDVGSDAFPDLLTRTASELRLRLHRGRPPQ